MTHDESLDRRTMVALFELTEKGHRIEHDSPTIGCWQYYGQYDKSLGTYTSHSAAQAAMHKRMDEIELGDYPRPTPTPWGVHLATSDSDVWLTIEEKLVHETDIIHTERRSSTLEYDGTQLKTEEENE